MENRFYNNNNFREIPPTSVGKTHGKEDLAEALRTAIINKRARVMGLISGRKAFQKPMPEGNKLLNLIQNLYLNKEITIT